MEEAVAVGLAAKDKAPFVESATWGTPNSRCVKWKRGGDGGSVRPLQWSWGGCNSSVPEVWGG
ncbi:hypothetical protein LINPERPRIM_LOCUS14713 [Linum perenne]